MTYTFNYYYLTTEVEGKADFYVINWKFIEEDKND